jgi:hypothetical protein
LNNNRRVLGQLYGAGTCSNTNCSNPSADIANYGKFSVSWAGGGTNSTRLSNWLDPAGTNPTTLDGRSYTAISGPSHLCSGSSGTYTVTDPPANFTWDNSYYLTLVSTSGNTATFKANNNITYVNASVSIKTGNTKVVEYNLQIGTPPAEFDIITYLPLNATCYEVMAFYVFRATPLPGYTAPPSYQWSYRLNGTTAETIVNSTSEFGSFLFENTGVYDIIVRPANSCGVNSSSISVKTITVVDLCSSLFSIKAYPNPVEGELNVLIENETNELKSLKQTEMVTYQLYDITKTNMVRQWIFDNSSNLRQINVAGLNPGVYVLVIHKGKYWQSTKIIIQ